jgi:hypothetical protein
MRRTDGSVPRPTPAAAEFSFDRLASFENLYEAALCAQ